jgi:Rrf2 family nitric oxide-sensitive transcriptional repressor
MGLVRTQRGPRGGAVLARDPSAISLGVVVRHFEAGQALVECFRSDGGTCQLLPRCRLRGRLAAAREAFLASLDAVLLGDCLAVHLAATGQ